MPFWVVFLRHRVDGLFHSLARLCWRFLGAILLRSARWFRKKPLRIVWGVVLLIVLVTLMSGDNAASFNVLLPVLIPLALALAALRYTKVFGRFGGK